MTRAYKFLLAGAVGPFSRHRWPVPAGDEPGAWVEGDPTAAMCRDAVHGCRVTDLPWWVNHELWEAEFDGPIAVGRHKISSPRARLVRRVEDWDDDGVRAFALACAWRTRDMAVRALERAGSGEAADGLRAAADPDALLAAGGDVAPPEAARINVAMAGIAASYALRPRESIATITYIGAHAADHLDGPEAMAAERTWQSDWLRERFGLRASV